MKYILKGSPGLLGNEAVRISLEALEHARKTHDKILALLETLRSNCLHDWEVTEINTTYTVGKFILKNVCRKCGSSKEEMGPPICRCCGKPLQLKVWEGKARNKATLEHLRLWEKEFLFRNTVYKKSALTLNMFFCNIGLYVCSNKGCDKCGKPEFYITDGD